MKFNEKYIGKKYNEERSKKKIYWIVMKLKNEYT